LSNPIIVVIAYVQLLLYTIRPLETERFSVTTSDIDNELCYKRGFIYLYKNQYTKPGKRL